jgi:polar amino acid transport system substrate-binding protein
LKEKMMKKICMILGVLAVLICVTTVYAGPALDKVLKKGELVVGTSGDYPPFSAKAKDGKLIGFDVDLAGVIAASMGVKLNVVQVPFANLLSSLESGKIDMVISAMTMTPPRNLKFAFVGPYFVSGQALLTTRETAFKAVTLNDVNKPDFTLVVPVGTTSETVAKNSLSKAKLIRAKNMDEALAILLSGKAKAILTDGATAAVATFRYQDKGILSTSALTFEPIGIAISPNDSQFENFLQNLLGGLKGGGELDMMIGKWFKDSSWVKDLP